MNPQIKKMSELIDSYELAVREHEMIGSKDPEDHAQIERDFAKAQADLEKFFIDLIYKD